MSNYYNSIKNDPCFKKHGYDKQKCNSDKNCMIRIKIKCLCK